MQSTQKYLETARKDLLDVSLRNPLISYKVSRTRGATIVKSSSVEVYNALVSDGRTMTMAPTDQKTPHLFPLQAPSVSKNTEKILYTTDSATSLEKKLLKTYRDSRAFIEELGVNVLYLAIGFIEWYEADSSQDARKAPVILIPVSLERKSEKNTYLLSYSTEEIEPNLSFSEKLRAQFGFPLPEFDESETSIDTYFQHVERLIKNQNRWRLNKDEIQLGFFSFTKLMMFKDLDETRWPSNSNQGDHPIISSLLSPDQSLFHHDEVPHEMHLDEQPLEEQDHVVEADSTQQHAIQAVFRKGPLVIQGPPGTGKSQTITNIIAAGLRRGKKILFVAEKMAALDVVKRRLDETGLGMSCLELHSHKTNRKSVLQDLQTTLGTEPKRLVDVSEELTTLNEIQTGINQYYKALTDPVARSSRSPYYLIGECFSIYSKFGALDLLPISDVQNWTKEDIRRKESTVSEACNRVKSFMPAQMSHFYGSKLVLLSKFNKQDIKELLNKIKSLSDLLLVNVAQLKSRLDIEHIETWSDLKRLIEITEWLRGNPGTKSIRVESRHFVENQLKLVTLFRLGHDYRSLNKKYGKAFLNDAHTGNFYIARQAYQQHSRKWYKSFIPAYKQAKLQLQSVCKERIPDSVEDQYVWIEALIEKRELLEESEKYTNIFSEIFHGEITFEDNNWISLQDSCEYVIETHKKIHSSALPKETISYIPMSSPELFQSGNLVKNFYQELKSKVEELFNKLDFDPRVHEAYLQNSAGIALLIDWLRATDQALDQLDELARWNLSKKALLEEGLQNMIEPLERKECEPDRVLAQYRYSVCTSLIDLAVSSRNSLRVFSGGKQNKDIGTYRVLDKKLIDINRAKLIAKQIGELPNNRSNGQIAVLKREFEKKKKHKPLRRLLIEAGETIQLIKPVFMMSPLSIAQYLAPGGLKFDIVIFDEASQVKPVDSLGALLRADQAVVVGDSQQLPPTNFFEQVLNDGTDDGANLITADVESVLSLFNAKGAREVMLRWHYRSRHESLINVSNHHFYDNRLVVTPSPEKGRNALGLSLVNLPDSVYEGGKGTNAAEAKAIIDAVSSHARTCPEQSLGIVAFSVVQRDCIENHLEMKVKTDPILQEFLNKHPFEPLFVKNLENVQGDERDVIFISIGYGRNLNGVVSQNFPVINREGGERRLNVLFTRARTRCVIYSGITADDIRIESGSSRGVKVLKSFLSYAAKGILDIPNPTGKETMSPFEDAVKYELEKLGYEVETQVGSSGYFIDLALRNPNRPSTYLLGIECDGAAYHSSKNARDRDRLRQAVLESMGWSIYRIWSTDWFTNPGKEIERLQEHIEVLLAKSNNPTYKNTPEPPNDDDNATAYLQENTTVLPKAKSDSVGVIPYYNSPVNISLITYSGINDTPIPNLVRIICDIVRSETPIHTAFLKRKITDSIGVKRIGSQIDNTLEIAINTGAYSKLFVRKVDFLWLPEQPIHSLEIRNREALPENMKKIEWIAPEEIQKVILAVVKEAISIEEEECMRISLRHLGFNPVLGPNIRQYVGDQVSHLIKTGSLTKTARGLEVK